jgi:acyl carrier protein
MTPDEVRAALAEAFRRIAPNVDLLAIDPDADLREEVDIDSMDFLNALIEVERRTGVAVPESDYEQVDTLAKLTAYIATRA